MKKIIPFDLLYRHDFDVKPYFASKQRWSADIYFSCIDAPKETDMLLYMYSCDGEYTLYNGERVIAPKNSIVYVPSGSRYRFRCIEPQSDRDFHTIIFNFDLTDATGAVLGASEDITVVGMPNAKYLRSLFEDAADVSLQVPQFSCMLKADLYRIIAELCEHFMESKRSSPEFDIISEGIRYLEESEDLSLSVKEIAALCNISLAYFERLFKEYAGISPVKYKTNRLIMLAKRYIAIENRSVKETALMLGFDDLSYFHRIFKKNTGLTPGEYYEKHCVNRLYKLT